ncbi:hypothetical protein D9619_012576 [Psilocybe cf. subviscida]|uniref:Endonuclease/exonuclease/phosphatase domain-containing protein n=1 Tax=Psilocybe cf. subviscida TaxID=2480587 RepID=A0A8H5B6Y6_9AGAR|nr:hypothetical protein D9619_012576 [Psilocybe cf. subviscida]
MVSSNCQRILSGFRSSLRRWTPINSRYQLARQHALKADTDSLSLITWNIDGFSPRPVARAKLLLGNILGGAGSSRPDIIFLQEVTTSVRSLILDNPTVRETFLVTDAEDQTSFQGVPFANMTLLSKDRFDFSFNEVEPPPENINPQDVSGSQPRLGVGPISRIQLPSKYGRAALCVDITRSDSLNPMMSSTYRLINVHLDSLGDPLAFQNRTEQLHILADLLRAPSSGGGLIAGDFNAISPRDHALLDQNGLVDAWLFLHSSHHGTEPRDEEVKQGAGAGATWGVGTKRRRDNLGLGRLDKVAILGVKEEMEVLQPGLIEVPVPGKPSSYIPHSDHCGLKFTFTL